MGGYRRSFDQLITLTGCKNANSMNPNVSLSNVNYNVVIPDSVRSRCRGGSYRRGQGWNSTNFSGYFCSPNAAVGCSGRINNNTAGGNAGNAGVGGVGQGYSNQSNPGSGNSGNNGNCTTCAETGARSCGNAGNGGRDGGGWGQAPNEGGNAGFAVHKKNAEVNQYSSNTLKGAINNMT